MAKFEIEFTEELWHRTVIEADSLEKAQELFWLGEVDFSQATIYGGEVQENIEIREVD